MVIDDLKTSTLGPIVMENVAREARLVTDGASYYTLVGRQFSEHGIVHHNRGEYGRGNIGTNTIESYLSVFEPGMKGVYLHRYLVEYDFRYNHRAALQIDDAARANVTPRGDLGKRLTYRAPDRSTA